MKIFIIFLTAGLVSNFIFSDDKCLDMSGYLLTSAGVLYLNEVYSSSNTLYLGRTTLRLNFVKKEEYAKLDLSTDFNIFYGLYTQFFEVDSDFTKSANNTVFSLDIRKMYLMFNYNIFDFYAGRQLIRFGEGYIFNPLNPFSKIDFTDINFTRRGVDALRTKIYFTDKDCFESILIPKTDLSESNLSTKFSTILSGWDLSFINNYIGSFSWTQLGFSFKGDAILGLYGEFLYNYEDKSNRRYYSYMFGADYSFEKKLIIRTEYTYNSFNIASFTPQEILYLANFPFVSQNYMALQVTYIPSVVDNFNFSFITNLQNSKNFLIFSYQRSIFSNLNLAATLRYTTKNFLGMPSHTSAETILILVDFVIRY